MPRAPRLRAPSIFRLEELGEIQGFTECLDGDLAGEIAGIKKQQKRRKGLPLNDPKRHRGEESASSPAPRKAEQPPAAQALGPSPKGGRMRRRRSTLYTDIANAELHPVQCNVSATAYNSGDPHVSYFL